MSFYVGKYIVPQEHNQLLPKQTTLTVIFPGIP